MNKLKRYAVVLLVIEELRRKGSCCGETHIQKTVYFLERLFEGVLDYQFILYKYGPFSFNLRDDLGIMESMGVIKVVSQPSHSPKIIPSKLAKKVKELFPKTLTCVKEKVEFITDKLASKNVFELETLATSLYVESKLSNNSDLEKAQEITRLKPHVSLREASEKLKEVKQILEDANRLCS